MLGSFGTKQQVAKPRPECHGQVAATGGPPAPKRAPQWPESFQRRCSNHIWVCHRRLSRNTVLALGDPRPPCSGARSAARMIRGDSDGATRRRADGGSGAAAGWHRRNPRMVSPGAPPAPRPPPASCPPDHATVMHEARPWSMLRARGLKAQPVGPPSSFSSCAPPASDPPESWLRSWSGGSSEAAEEPVRSAPRTAARTWRCLRGPPQPPGAQIPAPARRLHADSLLPTENTHQPTDLQHPHRAHPMEPPCSRGIRTRPACAAAWCLACCGAAA